jgi:UDP-N-acetylglucosamine transferase subunit ALG13
MIFVSTGTLPLPFSRLVDTVIDYYQDKPNNHIVIQSGVYQPLSLPSHITCKPFIDFKQTIQLYQKADLVISAAGEASVFLILKHSKNTPIFVPRVKSFHEHVDNKQLTTCSYLKKHQLADIAIETQELINLLMLNRQNSKRNNKKLPHKSSSLNNLVSSLHSIT